MTLETTRTSWYQTHLWLLKNRNKTWKRYLQPRNYLTIAEEKGLASISTSYHVDGGDGHPLRGEISHGSKKGHKKHDPAAG
jgi:hypothetical protein